MNKKLVFEIIELIVFDFDGVLTNNLVHLDQNGTELVSCSRSDGLAFDALRKLKKPVHIISTEKNPIVGARAKKLKVPVLQGIQDKQLALVKLAEMKKYKLENILYVGNDLNDYKAMQHCGFRVCPADSHIDIKNIANIVLLSKGGDGAVRELIEIHFKINFLDLLY